MSLWEAILLNQFLIFTLVLARISGLVMIAPIFGSRTAPMQVRGLLAVAIALLVTPSYSATPVAYPGNTLNFLVYLGGEMLVGLALGFGMLILFSGVQIAGQVISQLAGLALADVFNPAFDSNSPIFSQLLFYITLSVFVILNGHRAVMQAILDTFAVIPPGQGGVSSSVVDTLVVILGQSFACGIRAAAPVMTALLVSTFVLALISRTMPQINVLAVGFGLNSMITFSMLMFSLAGIVWTFQDQVLPMLDLLHQALLDDAIVQSSAVP